MLEIFGRDCYGVNKLPRDCSVVDAGANIGSFTTYVKWVIPSARVIAIEPSPSNLEYLKKNLSLFTPQEVEIMPVALGASEGSLRLAGSTSDSLRTGPSGDSEVEVKTLGQVLANRPVDLLKMDIEGSEVAVLKAAVTALTKVRRVAIEYHRYREHSESLGEMISALEQAGFDRFRLHSEVTFNWQDDALPAYSCQVEASRAP